MSEPLNKKPEADDPMELRGLVCDGDPEFMIDCVIEEYVRMGWTADQVLHLFESPSYPLLHQFLRVRGVKAVRAKTEETARRWGVFRFRTEEATESELVEIKPASEKKVGE